MKLHFALLVILLDLVGCSRDISFRAVDQATLQPVAGMTVLYLGDDRPDGEYNVFANPGLTQREARITDANGMVKFTRKPFDTESFEWALKLGHGPTEKVNRESGKWVEYALPSRTGWGKVAVPLEKQDGAYVVLIWSMPPSTRPAQ